MRDNCKIRKTLMKKENLRLEKFEKKFTRERDNRRNPTTKVDQLSFRR